MSCPTCAGEWMARYLLPRKYNLVRGRVFAVPVRRDVAPMRNQPVSNWSHIAAGAIRRRKTTVDAPHDEAKHVSYIYCPATEICHPCSVMTGTTIAAAERNVSRLVMSRSDRAPYGGRGCENTHVSCQADVANKAQCPPSGHRRIST